MATEFLNTFFGGAAKVRLIKLFLYNPEKTFDVGEAASRAKVPDQNARKEIENLERIGFLRTNSYVKDIRRQRNRKVFITRKKTHGWTLNQKFPYMEALETFLSNINPFKHKDIIEKISKAGKIQLVIVAGIFIKDPNSRVDLLVVGDNIKESFLEGVIHSIEADIGKEIRYAFFETAEFNYRRAVFDRLIRDILDYPHEKIINRLEI